MFFKRLKREYSTLPTKEIEANTPTKQQQFVKPTIWKAISYTLVAFFGIAFGVALSQWNIGGLVNDGYPHPSGNTYQAWYQNDTFTGSPSAHTEKAWEELIPLGRGFVIHPRLAPVQKAIAAYHQIHCLHGIRIAYYTRINELHKLQNPLLGNRFLEELGADAHAHHVDHCFEYLRQALICAADSNLEDVDETGEAKGWGEKRVCRNYEELTKWSTKWRAGEDDGIL
ncbi:hypothetical protein N0V90_010306 [Kalmusia sp. IMI 367209]|nr:hypothetical protein N0V90_010306 [Kalmusia sp. IMI 367209]